MANKEHKFCTNYNPPKEENMNSIPQGLSNNSYEKKDMIDCFELKKNLIFTKKLKEQVAKYSFIHLKKISLKDLSKKEILENIKTITFSAFRQIELKMSIKDSKNQEYFLSYIYSIVQFLTRIKFLSEMNQKININEISEETYNRNLVSLSYWKVITLELVRFLRKHFEFNIRTKFHDTLSRSTQISIRRFKTLYELIDDKTISYLNKDFHTIINIHYNGKCQGKSGRCPFHINYRYLPALSYHHLLKNYKKLITSKKFKYINPSKVLNYTFNNAVKLMQTQIGGLGLICMNCHLSNHAIIYNFSPIFTFLQDLSLKNVNENPSYILNKVKSLVNMYFSHKKEKSEISKNYTQAQKKAIVKDSIRKSLLAFIKKKFIISFLFGNDYICPICHKTNINEHLYCFVAHHTNEKIFRDGFKKINFGNKYKYKNIDWLIKNLIHQECIYICLNCHRMLHATNFRDNVLIILKNENDERYVNDFYNQLNRQINIQRNKILDFKNKLENHSIQIPNPFRLIFEKGRGLRRNLICIYYICEIFSKDKENPFFTSGELNFIINKNRSFRNFKDELFNLNYIIIAKDFQIFYQITPKGRKKAKELINIILNDFPNRFKNLIDKWEKRYIEYRQKMKENKYYIGNNI